MPFINGIWQKEDDSVAGRVAGLTATDSPLNRAATGIGLATANRRGLVNSSMAAGAATGAVLDRAVPIASQDAQQIYGKNVQQMQTEGQTNLQTMQGDQQTRINTANLAAAERERLANSMTTLAGNYQQGIGETLQNEKIPADARAAAQGSFKDLMYQQIAALQNLYGVNLGWT